jgi:hypothetical protein
MNICVEVKCPYCGISNKLLVDIDSVYIYPRVVTCDMEEGGCDKDFVIKPHLSISTKIFKIQEDEPDGK